MTAKSIALLIGFIFIAVGILGFVANPIIGDSDNAIFHADKIHNWVHIVSGILFVLVALAAPASASGFMMVFGIVYLLIGVVGFVSVGTEGRGTVLGFLHVNGADNYLHVALGIVILLSGMAMLQVVINPLLRTAGGEENFAFNSVLAQLIFGLASFLSPLVYSRLVLRLRDQAGDGIVGVLRKLVPAELPWISLYWLFAVICLAMVLIIALSRFPAVQLSADEKTGPLKTYAMLFKQKLVILYFVGMICYVGTEQGVANWISQFLASYHGYDPQTTGAENVAYFWGLMTAGGVVGLLLLKLMDSRRVLILFIIAALLCLSLALFGPARVALIAFPAVGFFASVFYPIIFSLALNSVKEHHGSFSGIIVTGIIGGAIVPLIIGWLGDQIGLRWGMCFLYLTMGYMLSIGFWAKPIITNKRVKLFRKEQD